MAKLSRGFLVLCVFNLITFSTSLWDPVVNSCQNHVKNPPSVCQCYLVDGIEMKCQANLSYSEFSSITQNLRERHNAIKVELKHGSEKVKSVTSLHLTNMNLDKLYGQDVSNIGFLKLLNLSSNSMDELEPGLFKTISSTLHFLDLSHNNLTVILDYFQTECNLTELNLSYNKVYKIDSDAFIHTPNLHTLDLSKNHLTSIDGDVFQKNFKLQRLNLSCNELTVLDSDSFQGLLGLQLLDLSSNRLHQFGSNLFKGLAHLMGIDLTNNNLARLKFKLFQNNTQLGKLLILGNPWVCDKEFNWIYSKYAARELEITSESSSWRFDANTILCRGGPSNMTDKTLVKWLKLMAVENSFNHCETCNICNCTSDRQRIGAIVDCKNRNLTRIPKDIPDYTLKVDLSDNLIQAIEFPSDYSPWWREVGILLLNGNTIESLGSMEGKWKLKRVFMLSLQRNRLREVPIHLLDQFMPDISEIYLSDNLWMCNCNAVRFRGWLISHHDKVMDVKNVRCKLGEAQLIDKAITNLKIQELCPQTEVAINYLDVLNIFMGVCIVAILLKLLYDYWYRKRTGKFPRFLKISIN